MSLLLKDCNIVDATSPEVRRDQYVLVEGDTIREVGSAAGRPPRTGVLSPSAVPPPEGKPFFVFVLETGESRTPRLG